MLATVWSRYRAGKYQGLFLLMPSLHELIFANMQEIMALNAERWKRQAPLWDKFRLSSEETAKVPGKYLTIKINHNFKPKKHDG